MTNVYLRSGPGRRDCWMLRFRLNGKHFRQKCLNEDGSRATTQREAEAALRRAYVAAEQAAKNAPALARRPAVSDYTLAMAFDALKPSWQRQADWKNKRRAIAELVDYFYNVRGIRGIADIGEIEIQEYIDWSLAKPVRLWK